MRRLRLYLFCACLLLCACSSDPTQGVMMEDIAQDIAGQSDIVSVDTQTGSDTVMAEDTAPAPDTTPTPDMIDVSDTSPIPDVADTSPAEDTIEILDTPDTIDIDVCSAGCPGGLINLDALPETGECGCEYSCTPASDEDPIDAAQADDNCDGSDGVVADCVFVSASLGDDSASGDRLDPVATIAQGIAVAETSGRSAVCVSGEDYPEAVAMVSGVSLFGGFDQLDPDFAFRRKPASLTTIHASGTVVIAEAIEAETVIAGLTILAETPTGPGESTYGVRLVGGEGLLRVYLNNITAASATGGSNGTSGLPFADAIALPGTQGDPGCNVTAQPEVWEAWHQPVLAQTPSRAMAGEGDTTRLRAYLGFQARWGLL